MIKRLIQTAVVFGLITIIVPCAFSGGDKDFSNYRYYPFQWVYPEYDYKAETVQIKHEPQKKEGYYKIDFFGLSAWIPEGCSKKKNLSDITTGYSSPDKKQSIVITLEDENNLLCSDQQEKREKDFCSAFQSAKEFYHKLFTLTSDSIDETTTTGDKWMIHAKGNFFENVKEIKIFKGNSFTAYSRVMDKRISSLKQELVIFHDSLPKHKLIMIGFSAPEKSVKTFLKTLSPAED